MKSKLILTAVAATMLAFTACNKKVDDKTMADINQFQTDWTALNQQAAAFSQDLAAEKAKITDHLTKQTAMMSNTMSKIKDDDTKAKLTELDKNDHEAADALDTMTNNMNDLNAQLATNTTAWTDWKAKVDQGQVSNDDATKAMTDWNTKLADVKSKLSSMQTQYANVKDNCDKNMAECENMAATMNTADASSSTTTKSTSKSTTKTTTK